MPRISFFVIILVSLVLGFGCSRSSKERPSPARSDTSRVENKQVIIHYSSPAVRDRKIWNGLVPYDQIWRTGANEATTFSTTGPLNFHGHPIDSGRYALFTIPTDEQWKVMLNAHWNQWGTYQYDSSKNVAELWITPQKTPEYSERMKFFFEEDSLKFHWEHLQFSLALE